LRHLNLEGKKPFEMNCPNISEQDALQVCGFVSRPQFFANLAPN